MTRRPASTRKSTQDAAPSKDEILRAEREVGENLPEGMKGLDTEDVGEPEPSDTSRH